MRNIHQNFRRVVIYMGFAVVFIVAFSLVVYFSAPSHKRTKGFFFAIIGSAIILLFIAMIVAHELSHGKHPLYSNESVFFMFIFMYIIGLIPARIATKKGRSFFFWWIYGMLLFLPAMIHSIIIKPTEESQIENGDYKKCPYCAEMIKREAKVCRYCGRDV